MKKIVCLLIVVILSGCSTGYHKKGFTGGYSDYAISEDTFSVSFSGNAATSRNTVNQLLTRRCSELTLEHGYLYFVIYNAQDDSRTGTFYSSDTTYNGSGNLNMYSNNYSNGNSYNGQMNYSGNSNSYGTAHNYVKPGSTVNIKCFKEKPENIPVIDAKFFLKNNFPTEYKEL